MKTIKNYKPFKFQDDSITEFVTKVINNGGGCLFDQTGLGKTITAATAAMNLSEGRINVLCPVPTKKNWSNILTLAKSPHTVTTYQTLPKEDCDILIIDEAHNLKNHKSKTYIEAFLYIKKYNPIVFLLTATPFQNNLTEFRNMLALINFKSNTPAFVLLGDYLGKAITYEKENNLIKRFSQNSYKDIGDEVKTRFAKNHWLDKALEVVSTFTIRNTRKSIETNYAKDMKMMGHFPTISNNVIKEDIFNQEQKLAIHNIVKLLEKMPFAMQNIVSYVDRPRKRMPVSLGAIMRTFLLKRLDSSVYAFKCSIDRMLSKITSLLLSSSSTVEVGGKEEIMKPAFNKDLERDFSFLTRIIKLAEVLNDEKKIDLLFKIIGDEKCVIFTEYNDTLTLLSTEAKVRGLSDFVTYNANAKKSLLAKIVNNFDANSATQDNIKVLFTTDVLAEGVNLHKATNLMHFDQKWNPSKITQRNGRINRLTKNGIQKHINLHSFQVDFVIEEIIKLEDKIATKNNIGNNILDFTNTLELSNLDSTFTTNKTLYFKNKGISFLAYKTYMGCVCLGFNYITIKDTSFVIPPQFVEKDLIDYSDKLYRTTYHRKRRIHAYSNDEFNLLYYDVWVSVLKYMMKNNDALSGLNVFEAFKLRIPKRKSVEKCEYWLGYQHMQTMYKK